MQQFLSKVLTGSALVGIILVIPTHATEITHTALFWNELINSSIFANGVQLQISANITDSNGVPQNISSVTAQHTDIGKQYTLSYSPVGNLTTPTYGPYIAIPEYESVPQAARSGRYEIQVTTEQGQLVTENTHLLSPVSPLAHARNIRIEKTNNPTTPSISWSTVPGANRYRMSIWDSDNKRIYDSTLQTTPTFSIPVGLLKKNNEYEVGLKSLDYDGAGNLQRRSETFKQYTSAITSSHQVLSPEVLARFALSSYGENATVSGYSEIPMPKYQSDSGFSATAFADAAKDSIVLAISGTDDLEDWLADETFIKYNGRPTQKFVEYVKKASQMLEELHANNPEAEFVITGHSLGGALAQLIGDASGLRVVSFNAPGPNKTRQYDSIKSLLEPLGSFKKHASDIVNYRVYGDLVSTVGEQMGKEITLEPPVYRRIIDVFPVSTMKSMHELDTIMGQLVSDAPETTDRGPTAGRVALGHVMSYGSVAGRIRDFTSYTVLGYQSYFWDPGDAAGFHFIEEQSSPLVNSITFPFLLNSEAVFRLQTLLNGEWQTLGLFQELQTYDFSPIGTDEFRFVLLDYHDQMPLTDVGNFTFGLTFQSDGLVNAELRGFRPTMVNEVPEPSSAFAIIVGFFGIIIFVKLRTSISRSTGDPECI